MRPLRSFLLLLIFIAVLTGLHYVSPVKKLFPSVTEYIPGYLLNDLFSDNKNPVIEPVLPDTLSIKQKALSDTLLVTDTLSHRKIEIKTNPIDIFLDSLRYSKGQVRVMYYGDSQIEGDRITSYLRQSLREKHGGTGPGLLLPLMPVMYTKSVWLRSSSNWKKYNYLSFKSGAISHSNLGPFMAVCRYLPEGKRVQSPVKAYVSITPSNVADRSSSEYDFLRIFYGNTSDLVKIAVKAEDKLIFSDTLQRGSGFNETGCYLGRAKEITIEFEGVVSPDIYGISIESKTGVIVDNIPQRGSAGLEFTMVSRDNLEEVYRKLKPDLFVIHYGLNIVKNVRNNYYYFQKGLERQLTFLKEISPSTPILVLSLSDMAESIGDTIRSYRNIPAIIDAQRKATINAGAAFWNTYRSMGGESSIIRWARKNPPLAQKDYVHFTYRGADTLSSILALACFTEKAADTIELNKAPIIPDTIIRHDPVISDLPHPVSQPPSTPPERSLSSIIISVLFRYDPDEPLIFSTAAFWLFFLIVLAGYSLIYKKKFARTGYLFLVSLFFYYKSGGLFLFLLIFVTVIDFACGLLIYNSERKSVRRFIIILSLISNLGILAYFKYTGFFVSTLNDLLGTDYKVHDLLAEVSNSLLGTSFNISTIMLPIGISFFTFQSLSYTIDVYRRKMTPVRNIVDFGFYVSFFPQLVAGPIVRASEFIPQLYNDFQLGKREFSHALFLISKGLIKKIIISDFIAVTFIDRVFDTPSVYSGFENLMAIYGYGLQIYCDFSGYTDIAIGLGLILGFRLPINFNSPYKASDISDFWKRWHISLSRWLKDYLYIPLGGNRKGKFRTYLNMFVTMLLGGLWHGAAIRFLIWGFLHGIGLIISKIWYSIFGERFKKFRIGRALAVFFTFNFVSFCWIFFRAPDMDSVKLMIKQITENFSPGSYMTVLPAYSSTFLLIAVGYIIHLLPEKVKESYRGLFIRIPLAAQMLVIMVVAVLLFSMRGTGVMPFIYFRF
jgi:alginate O-acetyltransferase complex protein AlgI